MIWTARLRPVCAAAFFCTAILPTARAAYIDGGTPAMPIAGTSPGAWADGYGDPIQSTFRTNFLVLGDETKSSAPQLFSDLPYTTHNGLRYFVFVYDSQETQSQRPVTIDNVTVAVGGQTIWSSTEAIVLNSGTGNYTLTPLGNGADMALYIPVSLFDGRGLTGNSTFTFTARQSDSHNGSDEWMFTDGGVVGTVQKFSATDPIWSGITPGEPDPPAVPEPSTAALLAAGLAAVLWRRRTSE